MFIHWLITLCAFLAVTPSTVGGESISLDLIPITAEEAFDAVQSQTDPLSKNPATVVLVDVRTRAEYFWLGAAAAVTKIILKDQSADAAPIAPDFGKVRLSYEGIFLDYTLNDKPQRLLVTDVEKLEMSPIASNIPFRLWNETEGKLDADPNPAFANDLANLIQAKGAQVIILFCRTGGRSSACPDQFPNVSQNTAVYEIDDPMGVNGHGGFEGPTYGDAYNGYVGFPGRLTEVQNTPSVSWKDSGLPIQTLRSPLTPPTSAGN
jgi:rhodanese-related sulfurtransferase